MKKTFKGAREKHEKKKEAEEADKMILKDGTAIRILKPHERVKYFGKQLNLINHTDRDIEEMIRKGWIKFSEFRPQLCAKGVSKKQKWLLFESVITSTVLYGSCSWTMNNERRAKLLSAKSKMVRQMWACNGGSRLPSGRQSSKQQDTTKMDKTNPKNVHTGYQKATKKK